MRRVVLHLHINKLSFLSMVDDGWGKRARRMRSTRWDKRPEPLEVGVTNASIMRSPERAYSQESWPVGE